MHQRYVVKLTAEERAELTGVVARGKSAAWKVRRAQALLKCDQGPDGPAWTDRRIGEAFGCTTRRLASWRRQAVEQGPLSLWARTPRPPGVPKLDGEQEAQLVRLACSTPPAGGLQGRAAPAADLGSSSSAAGGAGPARVSR